MPCHSAIDPKPTICKPDDTVEAVLKKMKKGKSEIVVVLDKNKSLQGMFSYSILLQNLMPVPISMQDGLALDVNIGAGPGIAKRFKKVQSLPVRDFMKTKTQIVAPDTPIWEGVRLIMERSEPVFVVEGADNMFIGVISHDSAIEELKRMQD